MQADFFVEDPWNTEYGPVPFENLSTGAGGYFWTFGDGTQPDTTTSPLHEFPVDSTYTVVLTAQSQDGVCSDQSVQEVTVVFPDTSTIGISTPTTDVPFRFGPNPFGGAAVFSLTSEVPLLGWQLLDGLGRQHQSGGRVPQDGRIVLDPAMVETGWHTLRLIGEAGRSWSINLIRR